TISQAQLHSTFLCRTADHVKRRWARRLSRLAPLVSVHSLSDSAGGANRTATGTFVLPFVALPSCTSVLDAKLSTLVCPRAAPISRFPTPPLPPWTPSSLERHVVACHVRPRMGPAIHPLVPLSALWPRSSVLHLVGQRPSME